MTTSISLFHASPPTLLHPLLLPCLSPSGQVSPSPRAPRPNSSGRRHANPSSLIDRCHKSASPRKSCCSPSHTLCTAPASLDPVPVGKYFTVYRLIRYSFRTFFISFGFRSAALHSTISYFTPAFYHGHRTLPSPLILVIYMIAVAPPRNDSIQFPLLMSPRGSVAGRTAFAFPPPSRPLLDLRVAYFSCI